MQEQGNPSQNTVIDRYISFKGIDCNGNAEKLMQQVESYAERAGEHGPLVSYLLNKRTGASGPQPDDLFLIHAHLNSLRELFEAHDDETALELLDWVEENCC
ncbi:N(2)-fixation sustaining protein CowN [Thiorhodospira sibirica]|uniref:N(2)-fixation sustaining protein CowN n=1 Tax=Thiorhodospira sibirica TaxID=154347 RepID=UPI00022C1706|nr:N(2)-fixation sustaining protein CowN [Thiorhodospira sibirica]